MDKSAYLEPGGTAIHGKMTQNQAPSSPSSKLQAVLAASLVLNLSLLVAWLSNPHHHHHASTASSSLSWTLPASSQAELAASYRCSGRGHVYTEMLGGSSETIACVCEDCFTGASCEVAIPDCQASVDGGDPLVFEPFWKRNPELSAVLIPGWYRIGYEFFEPLVPALEEQIRALHALVGNAVTEGKYIVVGNGATQLLMAAFSSFSSDGHTPIVVEAPYYDAYKRQVVAAKPGNTVWVESSLEDGLAASPIEIVTSPNNPDGSLRTRILSRTDSHVIYDHAYYWPHYTPITESLDHDIMFFTLSKTTGHAGSRLGWAILKDFSVYEKMIMGIRLNSVGVSHDSQVRAAHLLRSVQNGYAQATDWSLKYSPSKHAENHHLFHYGHSKLRSRWERMVQALKGSHRFRIQQDLEPKYCNFFKDTVQPAPAFAWIQCLREEDVDCTSLFERAGIFGRGGARCGVTDQYVRLAMMSTDSMFENLISRVEALVNE